jgi:hypothetical protein
VHLLLLFALSVHVIYAGGSTRDAIHTSDLIVVGDVISGSAADHVTNVECSMSVSPERVLKGDPNLAHHPIAVHWQYQPRGDQPPSVTTKIDHPHAIWFLQKTAEGRYEALWVEVNLQNRGGYYLEVPRVEPYGVFAYPSSAGFERKLAGELGAALENIAQQQGSALDMKWRTGGSPGYRLTQPQVAPQVMQFRSLAFAFRELDAAPLQDIATHLANSSLIHLKALGLFGQLKAKQAAALLDLERNLPALVATDYPLGLSFWASTIDIRGTVDAIHAVGRMAIAETQLLGFADAAVNQLSHTGNPAAIPYLEVMLSHPKAPVRTMAAGGICAALQSPELKNAGSDQVCNVNRAIPEDALKQWLAELIHYPALQAPSWYNTAPEPPRQEVEVSSYC